MPFVDGNGKPYYPPVSSSKSSSSSRANRGRYTRSPVNTKVTFEQLVAALITQESGDNYNSRGILVNGDRAYGRYQIMGNNIPAWSREVLGRSVSIAEFMSSPALQDKIAQGKLRQYYDKYGPEGAAAAWYGGEGGVKKLGTAKGDVKYHGTSINEYVASVMSMARGGKSSWGASVSSGTAAGVGANVDYDRGSNPDTGIIGGGNNLDFGDTWTQKDFEAALAAAGFGSYLVNAYPELKKKFADAIKEQWTSDRFIGEIRGTSWYRDRAASVRAYDADRLNDPATYSRKVHDYQQSILTLANSLGVSLDSKRLDQLAKTAYKFNMSPGENGELHRMVAAEFNYKPGTTGRGQAADTMNRVRELAAAYGISQSSKTFGATVERILKGEDSIEGVKNLYREKAKRLYSQFSREIDAGQTVDEIIEPYRQMAAKVYEINPEDIFLTDPMIQKGVSYRGSTNHEPRALALWEYEEQLKRDPRWLKTNNARESMMSIGHQLLQQFGLKGA